MAEDLGEKTEDPTPRKLQKARDEGQIAKSTDMASAMTLAAVTLILWVFATPSLDRLGRLLRGSLENAGRDVSDGHGSMIANAAEVGLVVLVPLIIAAWIAAYLSHLWQVGFGFRTKPVEPSLEKIDPIKGVKRIIGIQALVKGGMDLGKTTIAMGVAGVVSWRMHDTLVVLPEYTAFQGFAVIGRLMLELAVVIAVALLLLAVLDYSFQKWKHRKDHRMTKKEVRDEHKEMEGDPLVKRRRMQMARQMTMQRIAQSVPTADVVVTNPEHISVAIKYEEGVMNAPVVVAMGVDHLALRIRRIAAQSGVPIVERKPLARLLHRSVEVGDPVPPDAYAAVAEVLAYVYRMNGRAA
ncbi:MAG: flagellar biosynthesis protein FlhB [Phycisphaerae bacterium]|nr:flagellar biosynthesis protein FlhB [Phycisphaerae bacterium]